MGASMTITLTREEAQQVLDAFLSMGQRAADAMDGDAFHECSIAVSRLRARLAQPEPEPVMLMDAPLLLNGQPLYTTPPQRERVQFPTMLRKMWSGSEVQAWLDENVNKEKNHG
jgi:hypothetical protein